MNPLVLLAAVLMPWTHSEYVEISEGYSFEQLVHSSPFFDDDDGSSYYVVSVYNVTGVNPGGYETWLQTIQARDHNHAYSNLLIRIPQPYDTDGQDDALVVYNVVGTVSEEEKR
jgi:hypothetical protein